MRGFLRGKAVKVIAQKTKISSETVYEFYNEFRLCIVDGALAYPHLFFGAGMILLLGPPANISWLTNLTSSYFPGLKPTGKIGTIRSRKKISQTDTSNLKSNIQVLTLVLFWHSFHKWKEEEIFLFRRWGYQLFYHYIYAPANNLDPLKWSDDQCRQLYQEVYATTAARAIWDYWATEHKHKPFFKPEVWTVIHADREFQTPLNNKAWFDRMYGDFKWLLKAHRVGDRRAARNTYWDEFYPTTKDVVEAERLLNEKFKVMYPELFDKYSSH